MVVTVTVLPLLEARLGCGSCLVREEKHCMLTFLTFGTTVPERLLNSDTVHHTRPVTKGHE